MDNLLIGTKITILASGSWVCPATGQWGLELHGGGGGGYYQDYNQTGKPGMGSGSYQIVTLNKGTSYNVSVGKGGEARDYEQGYPGEATSFGNYSVDGGVGGNAGYDGSGNISDGQYGSPDHSQPYGNGGSGGSRTTGSQSGFQGAVILTFLG